MNGTRGAVGACAVATVIIAGAGAVYRATQQAPAAAAGPDPVVTTLPARAAAPAASSDPLATARMHLARARETDDPREGSYAEAALGPLFAAGSPPVTASFLRAVLLQRRHDFAGATRDLEVVLAAEPAHADARLTLAFVQLATGNAVAAEQTCTALAGVAPAYVQDACLASAWTRLDRSRDALVRLQHTTTAADVGLSASEMAWLFSLQAESAESLGLREADTWYARSLALDPSDRYTRIAYADWLLDHDRAADALGLLQAAPPGEEPDAFLLRRALALQATHADATRAAATLRSRYDAMTERGDPLHLREEVRFRVAFDPAPDAAKLLDLAARNYAIQREPWDARVLLEACARSAHRAPCDEVLHDTENIEHPKIRALRTDVAKLAP